MINEKQRKQINKILREIESLEKEFLDWCTKDITFDSFDDPIYIQGFDKMCLDRCKIECLKEKLAKLYVLHG